MKYLDKDIHNLDIIKDLEKFKINRLCWNLNNSLKKIILVLILLNNQINIIKMH